MNAMTMTARLCQLFLAFVLLVGCHAPNESGDAGAIKFGPPVPGAGPDGSFLGSNGPDKPLVWKYPSSGASGGWTTSLDIDFRTQPNQVFPTDGSYTIAGKTWKKANSAWEASTGIQGCTSGCTGGGSGDYIIPACSSPLTINVGAGIPADFVSGVYTYFAFVVPGYGSMVGLVTANGGSTITMTNQCFAGTSAPGTHFTGGLGSMYAPAMIINGQGMQFVPRSGTNYFGSTRNSIFMEFPLTSAVATAALDTPTRAWSSFDQTIDNSGLDYDGAIMSFDILTSGGSTGIEIVRGYNNCCGGTLGFLGGVAYTNFPSQAVPNPTPVSYAGANPHSTLVIQNPIGFNGVTTQLAGATYDAGWPLAQALVPIAQGSVAPVIGPGVVSLTDGGTLAIGTGDQLVIGLGALRGGAGTTGLREVVTNFRVDIGGYN